MSDGWGPGLGLSELFPPPTRFRRLMWRLNVAFRRGKRRVDRALARPQVAMALVLAGTAVLMVLSYGIGHDDGVAAQGRVEHGGCR